MIGGTITQVAASSKTIQVYTAALNARYGKATGAWRTYVLKVAVDEL